MEDYKKGNKGGSASRPSLTSLEKTTTKFNSKNKSITAAVTCEEDSKNCCICLETPKCVVFLPCKHLCVCDACGGVDDDKVTYSAAKLKCCPICRENIKQRYKVFM